MRGKRERMSLWTGTNPSPGPRWRMKAPPRSTPSPRGGEGIGSEAGPCQESWHFDRGFGLREQRTNPAPCPRSSSWRSAVLSRPLFSSTFPVRSLVFSESARRRVRACTTRVAPDARSGNGDRSPYRTVAEAGENAGTAPGPSIRRRTPVGSTWVEAELLTVTTGES